VGEKSQSLEAPLSLFKAREALGILGLFTLLTVVFAYPLSVEPGVASDWRYDGEPRR